MLYGISYGNNTYVVVKDSGMIINVTTDVFGGYLLGRTVWRRYLSTYDIIYTRRYLCCYCKVPAMSFLSPNMKA